MLDTIKNYLGEGYGGGMINSHSTYITTKVNEFVDGKVAF